VFATVLVLGIAWYTVGALGKAARTCLDLDTEQLLHVPRGQQGGEAVLGTLQSGLEPWGRLAMVPLEAQVVGTL